MSDTTLNLALQNLGLDDKEAKIYLALLELGKGTVADVAKQSGVKRTNIYNFIGPMKDKHIIGEIIQDKQIILIPENPQALIKRAEQNFVDIKNLLPNLLSIFNTPESKPKVKFFDGAQGIKNAWDDMTTSGENIYGFSDYEKMFGVFPDDWLGQIPKTRAQNKQFYYCIAKDGPWGKKIKSRDKKQLRQTKLVKNLNLDTEINIYGGKVLLISFRKPYSAIIIEERAIAMSLKSIWQLIWDGLK
ncbi:MAG: hypothetical protein A3J93_02545 [Candidatus Magasanikbacteria bacterium RIFOXYC2_FULL_42_28]|uniref:Transcription regulator TrmB N-terminal domain-containing protein n=1 Tax=Candidatus Magasanikbacteria bacterium RIFOXYC2_FULL_42_28 TaxID=1798704 RepID=A0A1F6NVS7_9BACT|nr:MAG: hypothetical protein A3J93_02545 [Candidatus Magasanikbacteria bacterium RIFOXYC2_FULL_42_28]